MLANNLAAAIEAAPTFKAIDNLARLTWRGLAEGHIEEPVAERLGAAVEARRAAIRSRIAVSASNGVSESRRASRSHPRSPDRQRSIERRRRQAASGILPPRLACHFTLGEAAALAIIGREVRNRGRCELPIDAIAAMSGGSRTTVKNALRTARSLGLVSVKERRRPGRKSDTNVVTVVSPEWCAWLKLAGRGDRRQNADLHGIHKTKQSIFAVDGPVSPLSFQGNSGQNPTHNNNSQGEAPTKNRTIYGFTRK